MSETGIWALLIGLIAITFVIAAISILKRPAEFFTKKPKYLQTTGLHWVWFGAILLLAYFFTLLFTEL